MNDSRDRHLRPTEPRCEALGAQHGARGTLLAMLAGAGIASLAFLAISGAFVPVAEAGPPAPNARTLAQRAIEAEETRPFDAAQQRADMTSEIHALRDEVASIRTMLSGGRVKVEVSNTDDLRLEIDYAKLRDALKSP